MTEAQIATVRRLLVVAGVFTVSVLVAVAFPWVRLPIALVDIVWLAIEFSTLSPGIKKVLVITTLIVLSIAFAFPFAWLLDTAIKPNAETMKNPPVWIPSEFQWGNFWKAICHGQTPGELPPFLLYFLNTVVLCLLIVSGVVASNAVVAYSFARLRWPGRDLIFSLTLATMMVPFPVLMVPTFALFRNLDWIGTYRPLWVPAWFGSAFSIFLLRQFFSTIPFELSEAAKLDGASEWRIFREVIVPLSKPALSVVALFAFMGAWNDFLGPLIYLSLIHI